VNRRKTKQLTQILIVLMLLTGWVVSLMFFSGCASTVPQEDPAVVAAREKARQDSLKRDEKLRMLSFANENRKSKQYQKAIKQYFRVLELDAEDKEFKDIHRLVGDCYYQLNNLDSAIVIYEMGIAEYPEFVHLHKFLAYLYRVVNRTDDAIVSYNKVLELEPESLEDRRYLVDLYISTEQNDEAIAELQKIIEQDPNDQKSQETLGQLLRADGDVMGYIRQLEAQLELDPNNSRKIYDLAGEYKKQNNNEKAVELYERLLQLTPEDIQAMMFYGEVLQNLQRYRDALANYQNLIGLDPENARVLCEMGICYNELKQFPTGRRQCTLAMQKDPESGYPHIVLGEIYEATVENCISKRDDKNLKFDDKLVFWFAYEEYRKARKDIEFREYAERRINYLQTQIPNDDDKFFHEAEWNQKKTTQKAYDWIN